MKLRTLDSERSTEPGRLHRSRKRRIGILLGVVLVAGSSVFITGNASATSTKHKVVLRGNANFFSKAKPAIEPKAVVKISCDSSTNTYTATVKNVSVLDGDELPFPQAVGGQYYVAVGSPEFNYQIKLSQNPKTALFDGSGSGSLFGDPALPECFSGAKWDVGIFNESYGTAGTMS